MVTALDGYSIAKNRILAIDLDRGARLENQIGTAGKHEIRSHVPCLD
jgi:hypothetical protein